MPEKIRLWSVEQDNELREVPQVRLDLEKRLEEWLEEDISILDGLKRDKTPREVVAQTLDYASWVVDISSDDLEVLVQDYLSQSLEEAFGVKFGDTLPEILNEDHRLLIVGTEIDERSERIIEYLSEEHGVNINAVTFQYFEDGEIGPLLSRVFLIEPSQVAYRTRKKGGSKRKPDLTFEELRRLAEERGVGMWYRRIVEVFDDLFPKSSTRSSLAFKADLSDTKYDRKSGTVFSLIPKGSSEGEGLQFQIYTYRVAALFSVEPAAILNILPEHRDDSWRYTSERIEGEWSGSEGFFTTDDEVERFIEGFKQIVE